MLDPLGLILEALGTLLDAFSRLLGRLAASFDALFHAPSSKTCPESKFLNAELPQEPPRHLQSLPKSTKMDPYENQRKSMKMNQNQ